MEAEEKKREGAIANDNNDSDTDSEFEVSYSRMTLPVSNSLDLKKAYVDQAEGRLRHIAKAKSQIADINNSRVLFRDLLKTEDGVLTTDDNKIRQFKAIYNERDSLSGDLIAKTKAVSEEFSHNVFTVIERGNKKKITENVKALDKVFREDEKIIGKRSKKARETLIKIEEALNSYSIIPVEPQHNAIYQIGVLYHARRRGVIDTREFHTAVSLRLEEIPHVFRWREEEGKILDFSANFEELAHDIDDYLVDESEYYPRARQQFLKRVKGIREELDEKKVELDLERLNDLEKLNALTLQTPLEEPTAAAVTEKLEEIAATKTRYFYPLLPEEILTLSEIVPIKGSFSLGYPIESLAGEYHKSAKQGRKKELRPEEHMKYALQAQRVVNEAISHSHDNLVNGISIGHHVEEIFPKIRRIEEEYKERANERIPASFSGTATEHLFSDYFKHLDTKITILESNLKSYTKKNKFEKASDCKKEIAKYTFIKTRAEKLSASVLQSKEEIDLGADVSIFKYGASSSVITQFNQQLKEKNKDELLQLKDQLGNKAFVKQNYQTLNKLHETERCLSDKKWKPLNESFTSYLDEKIDSLEGKKKETTIDEHQRLMSAIEADTSDTRKMQESAVSYLSFYQPPGEEETPKAKKLFKESALTLAASIFD